MSTNAPYLSKWSVIAGCALIVWRLVSNVRTEERRRRENNQPHTTRDTLLLLLSASLVVGIILFANYLKPLNPLTSSRAGLMALILLVGGGLSYVFSRKGDGPHS
jgi:hypothetical protein